MTSRALSSLQDRRIARGIKASKRRAAARQKTEKYRRALYLLRYVRKNARPK